ncbi:HAD-IIB family hydrolase [Flexithrix dorotheae]|uniref:HAD-IIB family hydrolase n=1 Tax=Flexithrix dorotheae TaxID=70993 RepID=UPI00035F9DF8|nr:HAD-IIB family hydrolase [Flexithrix dorotheae]
MAKPIIFTDLDGTLIDFKTYSFERTKDTVEKLTQKGIPIVFCSSKTRVEQAYYRKALKNEHPFITENGSAIFVPSGYFNFDFDYQKEIENYKVIELGVDYKTIRKTIESAREKTKVANFGYADLDLEEISSIIKLAPEAAKRASTRDYTETIIKGDVTSPAFEEFKEELLQNNLICVSGGKYHTVMGKQSDKGKAVEKLASLYRKAFGEVLTIGLGDSANDQPLLKVVDQGYLVQKPGNYWEDMDIDGLNKINGIGPEGWVLATSPLLVK